MKALATIALAAVSGCMLGPDYQRPQKDVPEEFRGAGGASGAFGATEVSLADEPWWQVFDDPALQDLVRRALASSYDLRIAAQRVEQAALQADIDRSELFPQIGYRAEAARGRNAFLGNPTLPHEVQPPAPAGPNAGPPPKPHLEAERSSSFLVDLDVSWELDLWGRIRRAEEASRAEALAAEDIRRGVRLTLVSDVAQSYLELLELDLELAIARDTQGSFEHSLKIFEARLREGTGTKIETARARGALANASAVVPDVQRRIAQVENRIHLLIGEPPGDVPRSSALLDRAAPPVPPPGLPSQLLERRPDILEAEQRIVAANARVGQTLAERFPRVSLTGLAGAVSEHVGDLTDDANGTWSIGAGLAGPLFDAGRLANVNEQAKAAWREQLLRYEQTVLGAFHEVSDVLIARQQLEGVHAEQAKEVAALEEAVHIALERYQAGESGYFEVLEAQQQLFPARTALAQTELARRLIVVQLYKALGGGWNLDDPQWAGE